MWIVSASISCPSFLSSDVRWNFLEKKKFCALALNFKFESRKWSKDETDLEHKRSNWWLVSGNFKFELRKIGKDETDLEQETFDFCLARSFLSLSREKSCKDETDLEHERSNWFRSCLNCFGKVDFFCEWFWADKLKNFWKTFTNFDDCYHKLNIYATAKWVINKTIFFCELYAVKVFF